MNQPLPPLPSRIALLPRDHRGFPIPWFVAELPDTGERDFRVADTHKRSVAVARGLCWVCGQQLGQFKAFVIGPMCAVNTVTSEPPCHLECAEFSAMACPFLTRPRMRRNDKDLPTAIADAPGVSIDRNPGVTCVWVCKSYRPFDAGNGWLIRLGAPTAVKWFAEGKRATREQVLASIASGYPLLLGLAKQEGRSAVIALEAQRERALKLLPAA
jgi:hypothetical protein